MAVNPKFPANNVAEFIAYAKANPGKVNMGTGGAGGPDHASGELLQLMTGIKMTHVPYRGCGRSKISVRDQRLASAVSAECPKPASGFGKPKLRGGFRTSSTWLTKCPTARRRVERTSLRRLTKLTRAKRCQPG